MSSRPFADASMNTLNVIIKAFGKQSRLAAIGSFDKSTHHGNLGRKA